MLTKEQEKILKRQAKRQADKYIADPNEPPRRRGNAEQFLDDDFIRSQPWPSTQPKLKSE